MKNAFTLIELLVVMVIMVVIMGVVTPQGSKMLSGFEKALNHSLDEQKLATERSKSFLLSEEKELNLLSKQYHISSKGVLTIYENSDDNN